MTAGVRSVVVVLLLSLLLFSYCSGNKDRGDTGNRGKETSLSSESKTGELHFITLNGNSIPLSKFRGRIVFLLFFYSRSRECIEQIKILESFYERYRRYKVSVIGVSLDPNPKERLRGFIDKYGITFPIYINGKEVSRYFGGIGITPTILVIVSDGSVYEKMRGKKDFKFLKEKLREVRVKRL